MRSHVSARGHSLLSNSLNQYKESLGEFVAVTGQMSLAAVTDGDVAAYFRARTRAPVDSTDARRWSPRTAAKHRSALNKFFRFLVKTHQVANNPVEHFELQRFDPAPPIAIDDDAFGEVFVHIESRIADSTPRSAALYVLDAAILSFMDGWGLRVSEASRIRSSDIILQDRDLYANLRLKGNKTSLYPITGRLLTNYVRWIKIRAAVPKHLGHEDFLFVHPWTGYRVSPWSRCSVTPRRSHVLYEFHSLQDIAIAPSVSPRMPQPACHTGPCASPTHRRLPRRFSNPRPAIHRPSTWRHR